MIWALHQLGASARARVSLAARSRASLREPDFGEECVAPSYHFGAIGDLLVALPSDGRSPASSDRVHERVRGNVRNEDVGDDVGLAGLDPRRRGMLAGTGRPRLADGSAAARGRVRAARPDGSGRRHSAGEAAAYLGPAHGFAGNVHALRGSLSGDELRERLEPILRRYATVEGGLVNWPPVAERAS